jgi:uncharacterized protein (UPF0261 family)
VNGRRTGAAGLLNRCDKQLGADRSPFGFHRTDIEPHDVAVARRETAHFARSNENSECGSEARALLNRAGCDVLVFHATGNGGRTMPRLATEGFLAGLLDLRTTELADEVCGGIFSAGPERIQIGPSRGMTVVLAPGCVDMCNFGARESVPLKYKSRLLYEWNANVTLMRTNIYENRKSAA